MKFSKLKLALGLAILSAGAQAAGPLYTLSIDGEITPYRWNTSNGPIPVYVDGGDAFTYDYDGSVFLSIEQANTITANAFAQWSNVETSTFSAEIAGTIESITGIADVTGENADQIYGVEKGYGFFINYDTDGSILEEYFGVSRKQVLGIAFPEWANEATGEITEATAVINGWHVDVNDTEGHQIAGVFTHEFGHAINMSHSQTNGQFAYISSLESPLYPGVEGCDGVEAIHGYIYSTSNGQANRADITTVETMFPYIDVSYPVSAEQAIISITDDKVSISNLYPTEEYKTQFGSISGTLYLKDGITEYSGINIIARNIDNPMFDAISVQTGNQTQGKIGPDGKFTINGLTPGASYVIYTDVITSGGYPTRQTPLLSVAEYWNSNESADPATDDACDVTPIVAQAGKTHQADMYFNGYADGIQYTPLMSAWITDLSKNGKRAFGKVAHGTPFIYDSVKKSIRFHPTMRLKSHGSGGLNRNGTKAAVSADLNGNGLAEAAIWNLSNDKLTALGDLNGNTCGSHNGYDNVLEYSATVWDIDDVGDTVVGMSYKDVNDDGDEYCNERDIGAMVPFIWTKKNGMQELDTSESGLAQFIRAERISGNGKVIVGSNAAYKSYAWVDGKLINLFEEIGAYQSGAISRDGRKVALSTHTEGMFIWDYTKQGPDAYTSIGGLTWCEDLPYVHFVGDFCSSPDYGPEWVQNAYGIVPILPMDMNDDGSVLIGRAGNGSSFIGAILIDGMDWMTLEEFFYKQGVVEAAQLVTDNPQALNGDGSRMMTGIVGVYAAIDVDMSEAYVCKNGKDKRVSFPKQLIAEVKAGAEFGRCAFIND
ncbi:MAG: hypothetical protein V5788_09520 [Shewanella sp.]